MSKYRDGCLDQERDGCLDQENDLFYHIWIRGCNGYTLCGT